MHRNNDELIKALVDATEAVRGSQLTTEEKQKLIETFNRTSGDKVKRARATLLNFSQIDEKLLLEKSAASDNTDRKIKDLENIAKEWNPD